MPQLERWDNLPEGVRQHLIERMRDRAISISDLNQLRLWIETRPEVPQGDWYKDFGTFKICGTGSYPKTFLLRGQVCKGRSPLIIARQPITPLYRLPSPPRERGSGNASPSKRPQIAARRPRLDLRDSGRNGGGGSEA
jgi:hypothetical protein